MEWQPISEDKIWDDINEAWKRMTITQRNLWEVIRIMPEKWDQDPYGKPGGGFWVVAIIGNTVIWYNDIEDGYNRSTFSTYGVINEFWCNQDELERAIQSVINQINDGYNSQSNLGPPQPVKLKEQI